MNFNELVRRGTPRERHKKILQRSETFPFRRLDVRDTVSRSMCPSAGKRGPVNRADLTSGLPPRLAGLLRRGVRTRAQLELRYAYGQGTLLHSGIVAFV